MSNEAALVLVRHTEICPTWRGFCYGVSDVPLSETGLAAMPALAAELTRSGPQRIYHSGLQRTRLLACEISNHCGAPMYEDARLREMDFGDWEGRSWQDIYATTGDAMAGLIHAPDAYAPENGETAHAFRDRVVAAIGAMPADTPCIAVTHGGAIGAVIGTLERAPAAQWPTLVPPYGGSIRLGQQDRKALLDDHAGRCHTNNGEA